MGVLPITHEQQTARRPALDTHAASQGSPRVPQLWASSFSPPHVTATGQRCGVGSGEGVGKAEVSDALTPAS